jgi:hypothetical protein
MAHSSGASRLALVHRTAQPGGGEEGAVAGAAAAGGGAVWAACRALLDLGPCWAWLAPMEPKTRMATRMASVAEIFTVTAPEKAFEEGARLESKSSHGVKSWSFLGRTMVGRPLSTFFEHPRSDDVATFLRIESLHALVVSGTGPAHITAQIAIENFSPNPQPARSA